VRFKSFEIRNFKGIEHAVVDLSPAGANIATLIGLNESGKTTILEAISRFSQSNDEQALYGSAGEAVDPTSFVPKRRKSDFTGNITITATIAFDDGEIDEIVSAFEANTGYVIEPGSIKPEISYTRGYKFEASDNKGPIAQWSLAANIRTKKAKHFKNISGEAEAWKIFSADVRRRIPRVAYFPTFLFTQPERVVLNPGSNEPAVNRLYRQIIENVAQSLPHPLDIQKHIVNRIITPESIGKQILVFWGLAHDKQEQVAAALSELSAHLTETVFDSWSKIFGGNFANREIQLKLGIDPSNDDDPKIYLQFALKDGTTQYDISERSLGFRWFFSFLLFTLYRVSARTSAPTLFLLDEPASNLHSRAQLQLVSSFPKIATGSNQIIYSTHSHYMINPDWLDQAFIVSNGAVDYEAGVEETKQLGRPKPTKIDVDRYRAFVGKHPNRTTYFQPVLDKLEVTPSRLDLLKPSVLLEGKGDYLVIEYGRRVIEGIRNSFSVVPTRGATGMDELIGLFLGWANPFVICLDDDKAGRKARDEYLKDWGLTAARVFTLQDVHPSLAGKSVEGLLEESDLKLIADHYGILGQPSKAQVQLFFSEMLAKNKKVAMSKDFKTRIKAFEARVSKALSAL
jgi:ABC-type Mn2+/Zn2+ transport system ATPase subunit